MTVLKGAMHFEQSGQGTVLPVKVPQTEGCICKNAKNTNIKDKRLNNCEFFVAEL